MAYFTKKYHPPGTPPGALIADKNRIKEPIKLILVEYDANQWLERQDIPIEECINFLKQPSPTWIHAQGYPEPEVLKRLGQAFDLHPLALEDVINSGQRPKVDVFDHQLFVVLSLPQWVNGILIIDQVSLFLGKDYIVSFYSGQNDPFHIVRERLRNNHGGKVRSQDIDYLFYLLLDLVVDQGFPVLEHLGEWIERIEEKLMNDPRQAVLSSVHTLRRNLLNIRRMLWPQREVINLLLRDEHSFIRQGTKIFLRDCYDHTIQIMDLIESYRDMAGSMTDLYLSSTSHRLNEIMRTFTFISTLFIPPTFLVGVYGMNFENPKSPWAMPELHWYYGYPMVWGIIILMVVGMLFYFKRRKWL